MAPEPHYKIPYLQQVIPTRFIAILVIQCAGATTYLQQLQFYLKDTVSYSKKAIPTPLSLSLSLVGLIMKHCSGRYHNFVLIILILIDTFLALQASNQGPYLTTADGPDLDLNSPPHLTKRSIGPPILD